MSCQLPGLSECCFWARGYIRTEIEIYVYKMDMDKIYHLKREKKKIKLLKFVMNFIDHLPKITLTRTFNSIQVDHG